MLEPDVYRHQILTSKKGARAERATTAHASILLFRCFTCTVFFSK